MTKSNFEKLVMTSFRWCQAILSDYPAAVWYCWNG